MKSNISPLPIANVEQAPERQGELAARCLIEHALTGALPEVSYIQVEPHLERIEEIPILLGSPVCAAAEDVKM